MYWHGKCSQELYYSWQQDVQTWLFILEVSIRTKALLAIVLAIMLNYAMLQLFITSHVQMADSLCYNKDIL